MRLLTIFIVALLAAPAHAESIGAQNMRWEDAARRHQSWCYYKHYREYQQCFAHWGKRR